MGSFLMEFDFQVIHNPVDCIAAQDCLKLSFQNVILFITMLTAVIIIIDKNSQQQWITTGKEEEKSVSFCCDECTYNSCNYKMPIARIDWAINEKIFVSKRRLRRIKNKFCLINEIWQEKYSALGIKFLIVIPETLQFEIVKEFILGLTSGHLGVNENVRENRTRYVLASMFKHTVTEFVNVLSNLAGRNKFLLRPEPGCVDRCQYQLALEKLHNWYCRSLKAPEKGHKYYYCLLWQAD